MDTPLRRPEIVLLCVSLFLLVHPPAPGQSKTNSPVFRSYRPPEQLPLLLQGDPTQQSWQAFVAMRKAHAGDPVAQQELALRYFTGVGVVADTVQAAFWMRKAADQDLTGARFNLGLFALHGWGTPWDPFESYRQFLICAQREMPEAQYSLGIFCIENLIIPEDWERGYAWIKRAAEAGYAPAREVLPLFDQQMALRRADTLRILPPAPISMVATVDSPAGPGTVAELQQALASADPDTRKALGYARLAEGELTPDSLRLDDVIEAANAGSPEALTLLGRCARNGIGMPQDSIAAAAYFLRGIRMESRRSGQFLWEMAQGPHFVPAVRARAEKGDGMAQFVWAGLLSVGIEVPLVQAKAYITKEQATSLLQKSSDGGFLPAKIELGLLYYSGRWVQHDERRAEELWEEAAAVGSAEAELRLAVVRVRRESPRSGDLEVLRRASESGALLADVALGYCYEKGIVLPRSPEDAADCYRSAWRRGSQDAYRALRRIHDALRPREAEFVMGE